MSFASSVGISYTHCQLQSVNTGFPMIFRQLIVVLTALFLLSACEKTIIPPAQEAQHLTTYLKQSYVAIDRAPLEFSMSEVWKPVKGKLVEDTEGLRLQPEDEVCGMKIDVDFDAAQYNEIHIRLKTHAGEKLRFSWSSEFIPTPPEHPENFALSEPLFADGEFQTYVVHLAPQDAPTWTGRITAIMIQPTDEVQESVVQSVSFHYTHNEEIFRLTKGVITLEALSGTQPPWTLTVPPKGVFSARISMLERAWNGELKGTARFIVELSTEEGESVRLVDRKLTPDHIFAHKFWVPISADLSEYAGQEITLHLNIDNCGLPVMDFTVWGSPVVVSATPEPEAIPIVLISLDTLRPDHLASYGYDRVTSPFIDKFAKEEAVVFEQAIAQSTWTLPSHMTMLTGLYPHEHNVTPFTKLAESVQTLPEQLKDLGYVNGGFTGHGWWLRGNRGFANGFTEYDNPISAFRHIHETLNRTMFWLDVNPTSRRFLFFHTYDIHSKLVTDRYPYPYQPGDKEFRMYSKDVKENTHFVAWKKSQYRGQGLLTAYNSKEFTFTKNEQDAINDLYDDSIRMVDQSVSELIEKMKWQGLYDNALIIITADHGETMNERGHYGHDTPHDEVIHVPLIVKFPKGQFAGQRYPHQVRHIDIVPTVQDVLGLPVDENLQGTSLRNFLNSSFEALEYTYVTWPEHKTIRSETFKLLYHNYLGNQHEGLYNLEEDPGETRNLYDSNIQERDKLDELLTSLMGDTNDGWYFKINTNYDKFSVHLKITSEDAIVKAGFLEAKGILDPIKISDQNTIDFWYKSTKNRIFYLQTASTDSFITVEYEGSHPFQLYKGSEVPTTETVGKLALERSTNDFSKQYQSRVTKNNEVYVWYQGDDVKQEAADRPSEAVIEELEALGYFGETASPSSTSTMDTAPPEAILKEAGITDTTTLDEVSPDETTPSETESVLTPPVDSSPEESAKIEKSEPPFTTPAQ